MLRCLNVLFVLLTSGCVSTDTLWRLDDVRPGTVLDYRDQGNGTFYAKGIAGEGRVIELRNLDQSRPNVTIANTLWLELDGAGAVRKGLLKRVVTSALEKGTYRDSGAKWYPVQAAILTMDAQGDGHVRAETAGEVLEGDVVRKTTN